MTIAPAIRRVATLAVAAVALSLSTFMAAAPASASDLVNGASASDLSRIPDAAAASLHHCAEAKTTADTTREGVFCADIADNGDGTFTAKAEGLCQTQTVPVTMQQCSNITEHIQVWNTIVQDDDFTRICGHTHGPCPSPPNRYINGKTYIVPSGVCHEVWTVVVAASSPITLPGSGKNAFLSTNLSSGHIVVCG